MEGEWIFGFISATHDGGHTKLLGVTGINSSLNLAMVNGVQLNGSLSSRKAKSGDVVLAYQTDRNELVGVTEVVHLRQRGRYEELILKPIEELRVKVRPLKQSSPAIARIPALQPGPIQTLYGLSRSEAGQLLRAVKSQYKVDLAKVSEEGDVAVAGGCFGSAEENRRVEQAAVGYVKRGRKMEARQAFSTCVSNRCIQQTTTLSVSRAKFIRKYRLSTDCVRVCSQGAWVTRNCRQRLLAAAGYP